MANNALYLPLKNNCPHFFQDTNALSDTILNHTHPQILNRKEDVFPAQKPFFAAQGFTQLLWHSYTLVMKFIIQNPSCLTYAA